MKTIVVSAVNLKVGGTLTILRDCLQYLSILAESGEYQIIALVYKRGVADYPNIEYIEMQWPKKSWIKRLWCEYVTMKSISLTLSPVYLWLSLHDTTPNVKAERRAVYCHNSFPFYKWRIRELFFAPKVVLFALFSKYAYRVNIRKNKYVIVQQQWFKKEFISMFRLREEEIIVAPPSVKGLKEPQLIEQLETNGEQLETIVERPSSEYQFFYAAAPDSHKNFECICRAVEMLENELGKGKFKVHITVSGNENPYTRWLYRKWGTDISSLYFIGYLNKDTLYEYYSTSNCLIFPSKVETWGLPITEFAAFGKPMLLSDLPYAHETAGGCEKVAFFNPDSSNELAAQMKWLIRGNEDFLTSVEKKTIVPPVADSWQNLFNILLK